MAWYDDLAPEMAAAAVDLYNACVAAGLNPRVTSTLRSNALQSKLYNRFLAGQSGYPVAPPGGSAHEDRGDGYCEAFDMVVEPMEALADVGYTWQTWGGGWNGNDAIHFELSGASQRAKARLNPLAAWAAEYEQFYNALPWYIQLVLPNAATVQRDPAHYTQSYVQSILRRAGF